jgi:lipopolysaccharide transport system permease protein
MIHKQLYSEVIRPRQSVFQLNLKEVWNYRDLLLMFVKRDFVSQYKQTILGPLWFFIQPLLTTLMFSVVFGGIAKISTNGQPKILFYLSGVTIWNYFAESFNKTAVVFKTNANIFGKVYFPRLISPLSIVVSGLMRLGIQMLLFLGVWIYFLINQPNILPAPSISLLIIPFLIFLMAGYAMSLGMIFSSLTNKYKDLTHLITFGVTLVMYATPIIYSSQNIPDKYRPLVLANPLAPIVESFRVSFLGNGTISIDGLIYSTLVMFILLFLGMIIFNKVEKTFMDTI